jgi:hypothetical protein
VTVVAPHRHRHAANLPEHRLPVLLLAAVGTVDAAASLKLTVGALPPPSRPTAIATARTAAVTVPALARPKGENRRRLRPGERGANRPWWEAISDSIRRCRDSGAGASKERNISAMRRCSSSIGGVSAMVFLYWRRLR